MSVLRNLHAICTKNRHEFLRVAARCFHEEFSTQEQETLPENKKAQAPNKPRFRPLIPQPGRRKYKVVDDDSPTDVFDVEVEKERFLIQDEPEEDDIFAGLNLKRGVHGVFDIEDLVEVLRKENAEDIFVASMPQEFKYVDYIVVCSGRSYRHMIAIAEFVRRVFKTKRVQGDLLPKIEGEKSRKWMAMDLSNIALHIFEPKAREQYDLESLWAIGAEYDKECNKPDTYVDIFESSTPIWTEMKQT